MNVSSNTLTAGGAFIALAIVLANGIGWWRAGRKLPHLVPFGSGAVVGTLAAVCTGGVMAWISKELNAGANQAGDGVLKGGLGAQTREITRSHLTTLTVGGGVLTALLVTGFVIFWHGSKKALRKRMFGGVMAGSSLGLAGGISGVAALTLVPFVNSIGDALLGRMIGG